MSAAPQNCFFGTDPRLHYLEWNPGGHPTVVMLHGNSANAWWWEPVAALIRPQFRLLALDLRGHGDSGWVRPAAYLPDDYARDVARFVAEQAPDHPIVVGHSMGGLCALAYANLFPKMARGLVVIDVALTSSNARDRFLRRLRALPVVAYADLETARARFRLMPNEGEIAAPTLAAIADHSLSRMPDGRYTLKFDRESFFGGDGLDTLDAIRRLPLPTLLVRGERSRIMTADASRLALEANPLISLKVIPAAHHHVLLERPEALSRAIEEFAATLAGT